MADINSTFFLSFCVIAIGYFIKRLGIITEKDGKMLTKIIFNLTLPAVIITTVSTVTLDTAHAIMPLISFCYFVILTFVGLLFLRKAAAPEKGMLLMGILGFNIGNFAYPIVQGIWGTVGLQYIAMFDVGNGLIIFGLLYVVASIYRPQPLVADGNPIKKPDFKLILKQVLKSVPLMSYFFALIIDALNWQLPSIVDSLLTVIGNANMFITLLMLGILLNFHFEKYQWKFIGRTLLLRYGIGLPVGILLYLFLPFSELVRTIVLIAMILPAGLAIIVYAVEFQYDEKLIGTYANITILISFFLMWGVLLVVGG